MEQHDDRETTAVRGSGDARAYGLWSPDRERWVCDVRGEIFSSPFRRVMAATLRNFEPSGAEVQLIGLDGRPEREPDPSGAPSGSAATAFAEATPGPEWTGIWYERGADSGWIASGEGVLLWGPRPTMEAQLESFRLAELDVTSWTVRAFAQPSAPAAAQALRSNR